MRRNRCSRCRHRDSSANTSRYFARRDARLTRRSFSICAAQPQSQAVLYARVSSKDQEKEGFSIPAQQRRTCNPSVNSRPDFLRISHLPPGCTMPGARRSGNLRLTEKMPSRGCGLPSSPHPSARCARLHFGQMPPLPRSRFRAHAITTRHT
jgi:hypothetical protein